MRIITLNDVDFNQEFVPSTDIKDINTINAKWDFLFRDPFDYNQYDYGNWRTAGYIFKTNDNDWIYHHSTHCNSYNLDENSINAYKEPYNVPCVFANSDHHYGQDMNTFGKAFNPYYLKTLDEKLDLSNYFSIPDYNKKIYVKGFDEFEVVQSNWKPDSSDTAYDIVESSDYYKYYNSGVYNSNLGDAFEDIDKTKISEEITEGGFIAYLPYLKDSQINKMFEKVKEAPWEPVLFKVNCGTATVKLEALNQKVTYIWKPSKNIAVKVPRYENNQSSGRVYDYQYIRYIKDTEYVVTPTITTNLHNSTALKIKSIDFSNTLKDPCTKVNSNYSSYEHGLLYIPNTEKLLHLPALDVAVDIRDQITEEVRLRAEGDEALNQKIESLIQEESDARNNADNALDQKINTEKQERIEDVNEEENTRIEAVKEEARIRKEEDDKLEDKK